MAEISNAAYFGNFLVAPQDGDEDSQLGILRRYDRAMAGGSGLPKFLATPASSFPLQLPVASIGSGATEKSVKFNAPYPMKIWGIDIGAETSAGSALTGDVHVAGVSILDAAEDIHAAVGTASRVAPEVDSDTVAYGESIEAVFVSTGGIATGGFATLWVQRL